MNQMNDQIQSVESEEESIRLSVKLSRSLISKIDEIRIAWGLRSRGATVESLLQELLGEDAARQSTEEDNQKI